MNAANPDRMPTPASPARRLWFRAWLVVTLFLMAGCSAPKADRARAPETYSFWPLFPAAPEDYYKDKMVQVTGEIKMYQNAPEIIVDHPDQIEIMEQ